MIYYLIGGRNRQKSKTNAFVVALSVLGSTSATISERATATIIFDRFVTSSFLQEDTNKTILKKQLRYQKISISYLILLIISIINTHITLRMTVNFKTNLQFHFNTINLLHECPLIKQVL
jgi:hypothetical protein